jgi:Zn ribbon nucleic-acid-binding protein
MPVMPPSERLLALRELRLARVARRMSEVTSRCLIPLSPAGDARCPKCDATMNLARWMRRPSGFDIRIFDCTRCDHAHIVTSAPDLQRDTRSLNDMAADALEEARKMAPGAQRNEALKKAELLRRIADNRGLISLQGGLRKV